MDEYDRDKPKTVSRTEPGSHTLCDSTKSISWLQVTVIMCLFIVPVYCPCTNHQPTESTISWAWLQWYLSHGDYWINYKYQPQTSLIHLWGLTWNGRNKQEVGAWSSNMKVGCADLEDRQL